MKVKPKEILKVNGREYRPGEDAPVQKKKKDEKPKEKEVKDAAIS